MRYRQLSAETLAAGRGRRMSLSSNSPVRKLRSEPAEVLPFRSEIESSVVGETTLKPADFTGLRGDDVKVSEYRLERYLNACSPTCHG
jgi:hypothetical protein